MLGNTPPAVDFYFDLFFGEEEILLKETFVVFKGALVCPLLIEQTSLGSLLHLLRQIVPGPRL